MWYSSFMDKKLLERVNKNLKLNGECLEWTGYIDPKGYGRISVKNYPILVHRLMYEHFNGELIKGLEICHLCSNPKCCNPKHLRQDTKSSNMIDMVKINNQHNQILTEKQVLEIKEKLKNEYRGYIRDIAKEYSISRYAITDIKRGKSWSWMDIT